MAQARIKARLAPIKGKLGRLGHGVIRHIPILGWARTYDKTWLRTDLIAGATVWGVMTPSAMAYSQLAGLPPQNGLYAAMAALIVYAVLGTSRRVKVTTSSTVAVMSAGVVSVLGAADPAQFLALTSALALFVGIGLVLAGIVRLGFIADFMSKPIIAGFVFGVAVTIVVGQLPKVLGLPGGSGNIVQQIQQLITNLPQFNPVTLLVSAVSLGLLLFLRARYPKIPAGLVVLALVIPASALFDLQERGVSLVAAVPQGLPQFSIPPFPWNHFPELVIGAMGIIFLAAGESLGTARAFATRYREPLDADQELIALGGSNIASGLFLGLSVDVSMSTTATSDNAGAKTQLTSLVAAVLVIVTLLVLAPLFALLPNAVLGVLVIVSVFGLMDVAGLRRIYAARRTDFVLAMAALLGVVLSDVLTGLLLAVILALVLVLYRASRPYIARLGEFPEHLGVFGDIARHPDYQPVPGILIVRLDAPLYYFNANVATKQILDLVMSGLPATKALLIDLGATADLDLTSAETFGELIREMRERNVEVYFAQVRGSVRDRVKRIGLSQEIAEDRVYPTVDAAVQAFRANEAAAAAAADAPVTAAPVATEPGATQS